MNILITGANGQLGSEIRKRDDHNKNWHLVYCDLPELDITNKSQLEDIMKRESIGAIINCAAYTAVDKAETDPETAFAVNVTGAANLARLAAKSNLKLIHVSTDFVFDGKYYLPYVESDKPNPLNIYGKTKLKGEEAALSLCPGAIVIRTSWLYSAHGSNFVKTMQRLGRERSELQVISDQVGTPTWAGDLAETILTMFADPETGKSKNGIFHYSNEGVASWYDFADEIMNLSNIDCRIRPIETKDYPTPAARPAYSVLNKAKLKSTFSITIPHWKMSLRNCIRELGEATKMKIGEKK